MGDKIKKVAKSAVSTIGDVTKKIVDPLGIGSKAVRKVKETFKTPDTSEVSAVLDEEQVMPVADEAALAAARKRVAATKRGGRASTILTGKGKAPARNSAKTRAAIRTTIGG